MRTKRKKTIKLVEPPAPSHEEKVRFIKLIQPPAPSKKEKARTVHFVKPPAPSKKKTARIVHYVKPPSPSKKEKARTIELVAVPGHIMRALRSSRIARDNLSAADAEKLISVLNADELAKSILRFLINHADRGFTASEICKTVEGVGRNKVRLLLAGLGVEYCRHGKVLFSMNPPITQTSRTIEIVNG